MPVSSSIGSSKRKAPVAVTAGLTMSEQAGQRGGAPSIPRSSQSKRGRYQDSDEGDDDVDVDYVTGDVDLEEQDRKRNQQGRKGRVVTEGYGSSDDSGSSDDENEEDSEEEEGQGTKGKGKIAGIGEDEDMFDSKDPPPGKPRGKGKERYLRLEDIEGQEFDTGQAAHRDPNTTALSDEGEQDPELELESGSEASGSDDGRVMSPGGTTVLEDRRSNKTSDGEPKRKQGKSKEKNHKPKTADPMDDMGYKMDGFNMKNEMTSGRFDEEGNYIPNAKDPHAEHDRWLEGNYSRKGIRAAREAKLKREQEARVKEKELQKEREENGGKEGIMMRLAGYMESHEIVLETLQRLGKEAKPHRTKSAKVAGKAKAAAVSTTTTTQLSQDPKGESTDTSSAPRADSRHASVVAIEEFTDLASTLLSRYGLADIYDEEYATLVRQVKRAGLAPSSDWDPARERRRRQEEEQGAKEEGRTKSQSSTDVVGPQYQYRWSKSYLGSLGESEQSQGEAIFGPFARTDLVAWKDAGYFGSEEAERIVLRPADSEGEWSSWRAVLG